MTTDLAVSMPLHGIVAGPSPAPAVRQGPRELSYAAVHRRAAAVTRLLLRRGVAADTPVAVCTRDPLWTVPAVLGVLRAGGAYLPLDADSPPPRYRRLVDRLGVRSVLATADLADGLAGHGLPVSVLDDTPDEERGEALDTGPRDTTADPPPGCLAYLILTSGSTGEPKAVAVSHRSAVESVLARREHYGRPVNRFLWHSPAAFDSAGAGLFWTLADGGTLVVPTPDERLDPARLAGLIRRDRVTHVLCLPRVWREVLRQADADELATVATVIVAGEAAPPALPAEHARACAAPLWNEYGPAEAAVWATVHRCEPADGDAPVPIGRARPGVGVMVLDDHLVPCAPGQPGMIWLTGPALARGYATAPGLTADRFVPSPFSPGERVYRTGDLAVRRPDGLLEFRGRQDDQIKIGGVRVESAEVEQALLSLDEVADAAVTARPGPDGRSVLVGYVVSAAEPLLLRARLGALLPPTLVPAVLVNVEALPRNANGKVDRRALSEGGLDVTAQHAEAGPPEGDLGQLLDVVVDVWRAVLRDDTVSGRSDLFALGGDSITTVMICSGLAERGITAAPLDVFQARTPVGLAALLAARPAGADSPAADGTGSPDEPSHQPSPAPGDRLPLSPVQRWFVDRIRSPHWNQSVVVTLDGGDTDRVRPLLTRVLDRHRMLAATFEPGPDVGRWRVRPGGGSVGVVLELGDEAGDEAWVADRIRHWQRTLDLFDGPVARMVWFRPPHGTTRVALLVHHLVVDAVSWRLIFAELVTALRTDRVSPGTGDHPGWVAEHDRAIGAGAYDAELPHWLDAAATAAAPLFDVAPGTEGDASALTRRVGGRAVSDLLAVGTQRPNVVSEVLLAALAAAACRTLPGVTTLGVDVETHGRPAATVTDVGWFTSFHPLPLRVAGAADPALAVAAVRAATAAVPGDGLGFLALAYCRPELPGAAALATHARPPVGFNYLGRLDRTVMSGATRMTVSPGCPDQRDPAAPRPHVLALDCHVDGDELVATWTCPPAIADAVAALASAFPACLAGCSGVAHADR